MSKYIAYRFLLILVLPLLVSCGTALLRESIPERSVVIEKVKNRVQKSIKYKSSTIFLQSRRRGIKTNDLIIENEKGELRYLSNNRFLIQDFCISRDGKLCYVEAGRDIGYEPMTGIRSSMFRIKQIDLNGKKYEITDFYPDKDSQLRIYRPYKLELDDEEKYICFATDFGEIYVIDLSSKTRINILP